VDSVGKEADGNGGAKMSDQEKPEPATPPVVKPAALPKEIGGPKGPEPTRYGDWEVKGRCTDF
jgi:hypothetical protein